MKEIIQIFECKACRQPCILQMRAEEDWAVQPEELACVFKPGECSPEWKEINRIEVKI